MASVARLKQPHSAGPFKVERGIPVPLSSARSKYPWNEMEVGDSFFVPGAKPSALSNCSTSYVNKSPNGKGKKFRTRTVDGGARVWRIA